MKMLREERVGMSRAESRSPRKRGLGEREMREKCLETEVLEE